MQNNRISISTDDELEKAWKNLPHGQKSVVIRQAAKLVLKYMEKTGSAGLGMIINGDIELCSVDDRGESQ